jgi:hypothetical protein
MIALFRQRLQEDSILNSTTERQLPEFPALLRD